MSQSYHDQSTQSTDIGLSLEFRGRLRQIAFDLDYFTRSKNRKFITKHGMEGTGIYLALISWLSLECSDLVLRFTDIGDFIESHNLDKEKVRAIIKTLIDLDILQSYRQGKGIYSERLFRESIKYMNRMRNKDMSLKLSNYLSTL